MKKFENMYSKGKNDECYTPYYAVKPIIQYVDKSKKIWCPFDTDNSQFVKQLKENGNIVYNTHISLGQDFYNYEPDFEWDCIISNPPFTDKRRIFEKVLSYNKPFALIMSNTWLNDSAPKQLFQTKDLQLLMFEERIKFVDKDGNKIGNNPTFSSSYFCWNFLPKAIIMDSLKKYM